MKLAPPALALAVLAAAPTAVPAGDRRVEILLVDASPPGAASERCTRAIATIIAADYTELTRRSAAQVAGKLGPTPPAAFADWTARRLAPLRTRGRDRNDYDVVMVVDCRPDTRSLDLAVDAPPPGLVSFRLRGLDLDARVLDWLMVDVLTHAWAGFSP